MPVRCSARTPKAEPLEQPMGELPMQTPWIGGSIVRRAYGIARVLQRKISEVTGHCGDGRLPHPLRGVTPT